MIDEIMHPYALGIIWALGRYVNKTEDDCEYYFIRHKKPYFFASIPVGVGPTSEYSYRNT